MNLRQMQQFLAVAEELHFGKAAARLNMAQPPLSQSIRRLELDLGIDLFDRTKRNVELTKAGRVFVEEARRTIRQADVARKMAVRAAANTPELRVSFIGPALFQLLPALLVNFRSAAPDVHVRLMERSSPEQIAGLRAGDFDVGFITAGLPHGDCESVLVERTRFIAAVPADTSLAKLGSISLSALAEQPFMLPPQKYAEQSETLSIFKTAGVVPHVTQEANQTNTTLSLVGAGLGCSLVMATAVLTRPRNVAFLHISDDLGQARWEMAMAWHAHHVSTLGNSFVRFTKDYVSENPRLLDLREMDILLRSGEMQPPIPPAKI